MSVVIAVDSVQTAETLIPWPVLNLDSGRTFVIVKVRPQKFCACGAPIHGNEMPSSWWRKAGFPDTLGDITAVRRPHQRAVTHAIACWMLPVRLQSVLGCVPMRNAHCPAQPHSCSDKRRACAWLIRHGTSPRVLHYFTLIASLRVVQWADK